MGRVCVILRYFNAASANGLWRMRVSAEFLGSQTNSTFGFSAPLVDSRGMDLLEMANTCGKGSLKLAGTSRRLGPSRLARAFQGCPSQSLR